MANMYDKTVITFAKGKPVSCRREFNYVALSKHLKFELQLMLAVHLCFHQSLCSLSFCLLSERLCAQPFFIRKVLPSAPKGEKTMKRKTRMNCSHNNFSYMHPVLSSYTITVFFYMRYNLKHWYYHVVLYDLSWQFSFLQNVVALE